MIVACVYVGDKYSIDYVDKLEKAVARFTNYEYNFICIRESIYPGWWAKLELFKDCKERTLFFDLDTVIVDNIDFLFEYTGDFATVRDFYRPAGFGTDVMLIGPGYGGHIYDHFTNNAAEIMAGFAADHIYMETQAPRADIIQDMYPGKVVSYKVACIDKLPDNAAVTCFHGRPKPHEVNSEWVLSNWRNL